MNSRLDSKQLFTQVEVNSAGYLLSLKRWGQFPDPLFTDTGPLRWRIVLVPNQWIASDITNYLVKSQLEGDNSHVSILFYKPVDITGYPELE